MRESIDLVHTKGYQCAGEIDLYGYLETTGNDNFVLISPLLDAPYAASDVTLAYEMGHKTSEEAYDAGSPRVVGQLQILDQSLNVLATVPLNSDNSSAMVPAEVSSPCYVAVILNSGEEMTIRELHFTVR